MRLRRMWTVGVVMAMAGIVPAESRAQEDAPQNLQYFPVDMTGPRSSSRCGSSRSR